MLENINVIGSIFILVCLIAAFLIKYPRWTHWLLGGKRRQDVYDAGFDEGKQMAHAIMSKAIMEVRTLKDSGFWLPIYGEMTVVHGGNLEELIVDGDGTWPPESRYHEHWVIMRKATTDILKEIEKYG